jgi:hypothetical protein
MAELNKFLSYTDRLATVAGPAVTPRREGLKRTETRALADDLLRLAGQKEIGQAHPALLFAAWDSHLRANQITAAEFGAAFPLLMTPAIVPALPADRHGWSVEQYYEWSLANGASPADTTALNDSFTLARQRPDESTLDFVVRFEQLHAAISRIGGACPDLGATILARLQPGPIATKMRDIKSFWDNTFVKTSWSPLPGPGNLRATLIQVAEAEAREAQLATAAAPPPAKKPRSAGRQAGPAERRPPQAGHRQAIAPGPRLEDGCRFHHERNGFTTHTNGECHGKPAAGQPAPQRDFRPSGANATATGRGPVAFEGERKATSSS